MEALFSYSIIIKYVNKYLSCIGFPLSCFKIGKEIERNSKRSYSQGSCSRFIGRFILLLIINWHKVN